MQNDDNAALRDILAQILDELESAVGADLVILHEIVELCGQHSRTMLLFSVGNSQPMMEVVE